MNRLNSKNARRLVAVSLAAIAIAYGWHWLKPSSNRIDKVPATPQELPAISPSTYLNTKASVTFVGEKACVECHSDAVRSYRQTAHSQALHSVDVLKEPPDHEFYDASSKRWYRVYRHEGQLWHRESIRTASGEELVLAEYPMRWVIGSGRFSRSYLVEADGFLIESPVTWYTSRPGWNLSPGYDRNNSSFERPAEIRCISCHVGRAETLDGSPHRIRFHSQAIDCERCHGPGSLHVEQRNSEKQFADGLDPTIVHPGRLDRERGEAICAQCHLHSAAVVDIRNRRLSDFRPGFRLNDFSIPYGLKTPSESMHVVGHVEQMRLSRCYQASDSLTCITCHDPHNKPTPEDRLQRYRSACLTCHSVQACGINEAERLQKKLRR